MHDIKYIRENPEAFDAAMQRRKLPPQSPRILELDEARRVRQTQLQELQQKRNALAQAIGARKKQDQGAVLTEEHIRQAEALFAEANEVKQEIATLEASLAGGSELDDLLATLPNILAGDVPDGADEKSNKEIRRWGAKPEFDFAPQQHFDIGEKLGASTPAGSLMDFESAAKISGARFVVLKGALARLERALAAFMLDLHTQKFGYTEINPPLLVRDPALFGTGQLPKFAEDLFKTTNDFWLIPTSEVALANLARESLLDEAQLPLRFTAYTPCFRSEAGAAGKDTRGMIRQHQFTKVELISVTTPEQSADEHERMTACAEEVLKRLGLHYRVMQLCSADTGFGAQKTYDIEVWLPGQDAFREISSCSNCGPFQARRMKARYRKSGEKGTEPVHTLNGSGLAIGRTIVAILEQYQQKDGTVTIPKALQPYMNGLTRIE